LGYSKDQIKSSVEKIQNLPTLPKVAIRILEIASDPEVSVREVSSSIHQDPALAARVLKVANSPFYGMSRQVDSLQLALVILGLNEVRNIALGITILNAMSDLKSSVNYNREEFWIHSVGCGVVARILGRKLNFRCEGTDFIAGLLHDIGKIIIDEYFSSKFVAIFNETFKHKPPMLEAEREILGESHEQVGGWLAEKWRLPETLCDAIVHHHDLPLFEGWEAVKNPRLVSLSYIAEAFCEQYEIGWDGDSGYSDVRNSEAWNVLLSQQNKYGAENIETLLVETLQAFNEARPHIMWL
jgi:HD-like signal output (HDOD) protein